MGASHLTLQMEGRGYTGQARAESKASGSLTTAFPSPPIPMWAEVYPQSSTSVTGQRRN